MAQIGSNIYWVPFIPFNISHADNKLQTLLRSVNPREWPDA